MHLHLSKALIHGIGLARQQQQHQNFDSRVTIANALSGVIRALFIDEENDKGRTLNDLMMGGMMGGGMMGGGDESDDDFLFAMLGDTDSELSKELNQCNINVEEIMEKMFDMMDGLMMGEGNGDTMPSMMNDVDPNLFINLLSDDDELACTHTEENEFFAASESFVECTGIMELMSELENYSGDDITNITSIITTACGDLTGSLLGDDDSEFANDLNECLNIVLGDNPIGNFIRDIYHHPDKWCSCYSALGNSAPSCLLQIEDGVGSAVMMDVNIQMSGSALKKATCLVGVGCNMLDDLCLSELHALDSCLPSLKDEFTCEDVFEQCELDGAATVVPPPFTAITASELPDTCQRVNNEKENQLTDLMILDRYSHFDSVCNGGSEVKYDSSIDSSSEQPEIVTTTVTSKPTKTKAEEEIYKTEDRKSHNPFLAVAIVVIAVLAAAVAFIIRARKRNNASVAHFSHIGNIDDDLDKDCELTVSSASIA